MTSSGFAKRAIVAAIAVVVTCAAVSPASARHYKHRHYKHHHHHYVHVRYHYRHHYAGSIEPFGSGSGVVVWHRGGGFYFDPRYGDPAPFGTYRRYAYRDYVYK